MKEVRFRAVGLLGHGLVGALFATVRFRIEGEESFLRFRRECRPVIFVFWHGQLLTLVHRHRRNGVVVLVSEHADGEYISRVIERNGFGTVRGSSTRGGIRGLKGLIRAARAGHDLALSPDGPNGPAGIFKSGALLAAQLTGLPVIPVAVAASAAWHLESWDRFMVPRPLSVVRIAYGDPRWVDRIAGREALEAQSRAMEAELNALTDHCSRRLPDGAWLREEVP